MFSSFWVNAFSNAFTDWWAAVGSINVSVEPHQMVTSRDAPEVFLNSRMSARTCSARSILFLPFLTFGPSSFFT